MRNLPRTIEAIFAIRTKDSSSTEEARRMHSDYLRDSGLSARDVPFLLYDPARPAPFSEMQWRGYMHLYLIYIHICITPRRQGGEQGGLVLGVLDVVNLWCRGGFCCCLFVNVDCALLAWYELYFCKITRILHILNKWTWWYKLYYFTDDTDTHHSKKNEKRAGTVNCNCNVNNKTRVILLSRYELIQSSLIRK